MLEFILQLKHQLLLNLCLVSLQFHKLCLQLAALSLILAVLHGSLNILTSLFDDTLVVHEPPNLVELVLIIASEMGVDSSGLLHFLQHAEGEAARDLRIDAERSNPCDATPNPHLFFLR